MSLKALPILLIVTSDSLKISFLKKSLKNDYNLLFAGDAETAIDSLKNFQIMGVLIDDKISFVQPFALSQQIRSMPSYRLVPVMLITTNLKKTYTQLALSAGISDFILAPLEKEELLQRLAVVFSRLQSEKKIAHLTSFISKSGKTIKKSKISLALRMSQLSKGEFFRELTKAHAISTPLCLFIIEMDNYTKFLKEKGAPAAAKLVQALGTFLLQHMRTKDLLFPQGDHCFLAILPTTSASAGNTLADMLREEVSGQAFEVDEKKFSATISIGLVYSKETGSGPPSPAAFEGLVRGAMRALQLARKQGNRTISSIEEFKHYEFSV